MINKIVQQYTKRNLTALTESLVPETPRLADEIGPEHEAGAGELELGDLLAETFNSIQATDLSLSNNSSEEPPSSQTLSPLAAVILDYGALEYYLSGNAKSYPSPSLGGPFCWVQTRERLNVLDYLSNESVLKRIANALKDQASYFGLLDFMLDGLVTIVLMNYYSEWDGYENPEDPLRPDPESFTGSVQSWKQTGFPGQKKGFNVLKGYEVDEYKENDWS
jgi:hypothetical protein